MAYKKTGFLLKIARLVTNFKKILAKDIAEVRTCPSMNFIVKIAI